MKTGYFLYGQSYSERSFFAIIVLFFIEMIMYHVKERDYTLQNQFIRTITGMK